MPTGLSSARADTARDAVSSMATRRLLFIAG